MHDGLTEKSARAFLAEAERISNAYDAESCSAIYADEARLTSFVDGTHAVHEGKEAIARAWRIMMPVLRDVGLRIRKRLIATTGTTLVNEWSGTLAGGAPADGIERWRIDAHGKVVEHELWTSLARAPLDARLTQARIFVTQPRTALAFLRANAAEKRRTR
ncbi:MAG: nuclear transport factor 2 family protein [Polyangiaceae bacterium]